MKVLKPNPEWTVQDTLSHDPAAATVFIRLGMACVGCAMARFETLGEAAAAYNMDLQVLLEHLVNVHKSNQRSQPHDSGPRLVDFRGRKN